MRKGAGLEGVLQEVALGEEFSCNLVARTGGNLEGRDGLAVNINIKDGDEVDGGVEAVEHEVVVFGLVDMLRVGLGWDFGAGLLFEKVA